MNMHALKNYGKAWWVICVLTVCAVATLGTPSSAYASQGRQTSESPYFYIPGGDPKVDQLPLKQTDVDVKISGVIADVTVVQHYRNDGSRPIAAKYIFPGSTRAAVYAMNVRIGDRLITANIREKRQARIEYEAAREEGKTAALLEEHLPNVFQMNVANILPGDDIRVEMRYTELLVPQDKIYQFVFPTVVGPRYNSPNAQTQRSQDTAVAVSNPYFHEGEPNTAMFNLKTSLFSPLGIKEITSTSHAILVTKEHQDKQATIKMEQGFHSSNRDFILNYSLAGEKIESGIMLYQGDHQEGGENFFLAMIEPPKTITPTNIPARDYVFVVDTSGSMDGFPLNTAKQVLSELIKGLRPNDNFNIMLFSGSSTTLAPKSVPATEANIAQAMKMLSQTYYGSGSTELIPALRKAFALPKANDLSRTIVVITDGYVSVENEAFDLIRNNLNKANLFAFGIGSSVNRHLIEGMARAGFGEPFVVTNSSEAQEQAKRFHRMIAYPVLTNVSAKFEGLDVYDVEPQYLPDVLGERPVIIFGKWRGTAQGRVIIEGRSGDGTYEQVLNVKNDVSKDTTALRYLWARTKIDTLLDKDNLQGNNMYQQQVTSLGLQYNLLTPYTSFIAVDRIVRNTNPDQTASVNQPSPMPQGVSDAAIGSEVPSTPEPGTLGAMLLVGSALAMLARHQRRRKNTLTS
ncbi:MAG: VIT domain-containing protein [Saezia sp.]